MKRDKLIRHLHAEGCELLREGRPTFDLFEPQTAPVPRHREIDGVLVLKMCKELGIALPTER